MAAATTTRKRPGRVKLGVAATGHRTIRELRTLLETHAKVVVSHGIYDIGGKCDENDIDELPMPRHHRLRLPGTFTRVEAQRCYDIVRNWKSPMWWLEDGQDNGVYILCKEVQDDRQT